MAANYAQNQWFDRRLSIGNLLTIAVVLAGAMAGWFRFENRLSATEKDIATFNMLTSGATSRLELRLSAIETERQDLTTRVIRIEEKIGNQNETLQRILRSVERNSNGRQ